MIVNMTVMATKLLVFKLHLFWTEQNFS